jgi:hypothetical protein
MVLVSAPDMSKWLCRSAKLCRGHNSNASVQAPIRISGQEARRPSSLVAEIECASKSSLEEWFFNRWDRIGLNLSRIDRPIGLSSHRDFAGIELADRGHTSLSSCLEGERVPGASSVAPPTRRPPSGRPSPRVLQRAFRQFVLVQRPVHRQRVRLQFLVLVHRLPVQQP